MISRFLYSLRYVTNLVHMKAEKIEEDGWNQPPGMHLIPLPFADDIRGAPIDETLRGM